MRILPRNSRNWLVTSAMATSRSTNVFSNATIFQTLSSHSVARKYLMHPYMHLSTYYVISHRTVFPHFSVSSAGGSGGSSSGGGADGGGGGGGGSGPPALPGPPGPAGMVMPEHYDPTYCSTRLPAPQPLAALDSTVAER